MPGKPSALVLVCAATGLRQQIYWSFAEWLFTQGFGEDRQRQYTAGILVHDAEKAVDGGVAIGIWHHGQAEEWVVLIHHQLMLNQAGQERDCIFSLVESISNLQGSYRAA